METYYIFIGYQLAHLHYQKVLPIVIATRKWQALSRKASLIFLLFCSTVTHLISDHQCCNKSIIYTHVETFPKMRESKFLNYPQNCNSS